MPWRRAFCIMNLRVAVGGEAKRLSRGAGAKASPNRAYSRRRQTRNRVIYAWAGWRTGNTVWRSEPVSVEKLSDDLCVGVKGQSNSEIARTPRNAFRCSLGVSAAEVERPIGCEGFAAYQVLTNSECRGMIPGSEGAGAKVRVRERNNSDHRLRPRNPG